MLPVYVLLLSFLLPFFFFCIQKLLFRLLSAEFRGRGGGNALDSVAKAMSDLRRKSASALEHTVISDDELLAFLLQLVQARF